MSEQPPKVRTIEEINTEIKNLRLNPKKLKMDVLDLQLLALERELKQAKNLEQSKAKKEKEYKSVTKNYTIQNSKEKETEILPGLMIDGVVIGPNDKILGPKTFKQGNTYFSIPESKIISKKKNKKEKKQVNKIVIEKELENLTKGRSVWSNDRTNGGKYIINETPETSKDKKYVFKKENGSVFRISSDELKKLVKNESIQLTLTEEEYKSKSPATKIATVPAIPATPKVATAPTIATTPATPATKINKIKTPEDAKKEYRDFINKAVKVIKQRGIDRIVIHGDEFKLQPHPKAKDMGQEELKEYREQKEKEWLDSQYETNDFDLDLEGSMLFLNNMASGNKKILNDKLFLEKISKGSEGLKYPLRNKEVILYIDVGGKNPGVETEGGVTKIYADHHGTEGGYTTSATQIVRDIMTAGKFSLGDSKTKEYLNKTASFIAKFDNLAYLDDKKDSRDPKSERLVDEKYLRNTFPRSLYSLAKFLPFETVLEILGKNEKYFKDGKPRDWANTFTREEIENGEIGKMEVDYRGKKITVKELVERNIKDLNYAINNTNIALKYQGNNTDSVLGKTVFHAFTKDTDGKSNTIPNHLAYITARALGNDAFVSYNPESGAIFINSDGKVDLMPIWEKLNAIIPGYPKPIRNQMMFAPKDPEMKKKMKDISQEKILEILGMKENNTTKENLEKRSLDEIVKTYLSYIETAKTPADFKRIHEATYNKDGSMKAENIKYGETLKEILNTKESKESLEKAKGLIRENFTKAMIALNYTPTIYGLNDTWIYWDIAKQKYLTTHKNESSKNYKLGDPLQFESKNIDAQRVAQEIADRHIGWEIFGLVKNMAVLQNISVEEVINRPNTLVDKNGPFFKEILDILKESIPADKNQSSLLPSWKLAKLGEYLRKNKGVDGIFEKDITADIKKDINAKIDDKDKKKDDKKEQPKGPTAEQIAQREREMAVRLQAVATARETLFQIKNEPESAWSKFKGWFNAKSTEKQTKITNQEKIYHDAKKAYIEMLPKGTPEANLFILSEVEIVRNHKTENLPLSEKIKNGISKGVKYWEEIGTNPEDSKTKQWAKKIGKSLIAVAIIGGASAAAVSSLAAIGVGTASALSAGAGSYLGRKMLMTVGMSSVMTIMPPGVKSFLSMALPMMSVAGGAGYLASKGAQFAMNKWFGFSEESIKSKLDTEINKLKNPDLNSNESLDDKIKRIEKEYATIEKSAKQKRFGRRLMSGVAALGTGIAVLEYGGYKMDEHNAELAHAQQIKNEELQHFNPNTKEVDPAFAGREYPQGEHGINTKVEFSSRGAIATLDDLKGGLTKQYHGDFSHAPQSVQDFMHTSSTEEAMKLGMFHPNDPTGNESMMIMRGSTISFDEHGNLSYHDIQKNIDHTLIEGDKNAIEQYKGNMFDSDQNSETENQTENANSPEEQNFQNETVGENNQENNNEVTTDNPNMTYDEEAEKETPINPEHSDNTNNETQSEEITQTEDTAHFGLTEDQLKDVQLVHNENVDKLFDNANNWNAVKDQPAEVYAHEQLDGVNPEYQDFVKHLHELLEKSGIEPRPGTLINSAETNDQYIERALEKLASEDRLEEVTLTQHY